MRTHFLAVIGLSLGAIMFSFALTGYTGQFENESPPLVANPPPAASPGSPTDELDRVKERYEDQLMSIEGVVGVGVGTCDTQSCIKVLVLEKSPKLMEAIPKELEGIKVSIEETNQIRILPNR